MNRDSMIEDCCELGNSMLQRGGNPQEVLLAFISSTGALVKAMREAGVLDEQFMKKCMDELAQFGLSKQ